MKHLRLLVALAPLIATALFAQQDGKMAEMKDKMKEKMAGMMDGQTCGMMADHREMAQLVEKLAQSLTAIEAEHDHAALAAKLAEHRKLIGRLQAHVKTEGASKAPAPAPAAHDEHKH